MQYEAEAQKQLDVLARKLADMRGLLDMALHVLRLIVVFPPQDDEQRVVVLAKIDGLRAEADAIQKREE